jgi:hypothetical protein
MLLLAMVAIVLIRYLQFTHEIKTRKSVPITLQFNPDSCVRLHDLTRLYAIKADPLDADRIWFCGAEGIRVLDQVTLEWRRFGLDHGLPAEGATCIAFSDSYIWAGTTWGLARLSRGANRFQPVSFIPGPEHYQIWAIEYVPDQGLYASVEEKGLFKIDKNDSIIQVPVQGLDAKMNITCLKLLSGNRLFIGTEGSIALVMDVGSGKVSRCTFERPVDPATILWDILESPNAVYIGTSNDGIWTAAKLTDTLRQLKSNPAKGAYAFAADSDGIWVGTPYGLWRYFPQNDVWLQMVNPEEREPTDFQVQCLYNTREQLWYGSAALGAGFFDKRKAAWQIGRAHV